MNKAAFAVGQLLSGAERQGVAVRERSSAVADLLDAARANGYVDTDGENSALATIKSGLSAGWKQSRDLANLGRGNGASSTIQPTVNGHIIVAQTSEDDPKTIRKRENAARIWEESTPITGTPGEIYLRKARGIDLNSMAAGWNRDIRYHAECPFYDGDPGDEVLPAIIIALRDPLTGERIDGVIHRIFLTPDGLAKATELNGRGLEKHEQKKSLGQFRGTNGAVLIGKPEGQVFIAEGLEDALTAASVSGHSAVAVLTSGRLSKVQLHADARRVMVGQAKNSSDRKAWRKVGQTWVDAGCDTRLAWPDPAADFNDLLRENGPEAVAKALAEAEVLRPDTTGLEFDHQVELQTELDYIVKGVLHRRHLAALYGPSGVGKTCIALDLSYAIAQGRRLHGRKTQRGAVLYVALEGQRGMKLRMLAYAGEFGSAEDMLARLTIYTPLDKGRAGEEGVKNIIKAAERLRAASGSDVVLIIIDTLARAMAGDDENAASDMAAFIEQRASAIAGATGAAVLVVHHPGKDNTKGMRGSTALFAACDCVIKISKRDGGGGEALIGRSRGAGRMARCSPIGSGKWISAGTRMAMLSRRAWWKRTAPFAGPPE